MRWRTILLAVLGACSTGAIDGWIHTEAFVLIQLASPAGEPVRGADVRALVSRDVCDSGETVSFLKTDDVGRIATLLRSHPTGGFNGCITLQVVAPSGLRDTTVTDLRARFRAPDSGEVLDTIAVSIVVPKA